MFQHFRIMKKTIKITKRNHLFRIVKLISIKVIISKMNKKLRKITMALPFYRKKFIDNGQTIPVKIDLLYKRRFLKHKVLLTWSICF